MHYWDVRRLLRDIERASDRWRLHEAWLASGEPRAVVEGGGRRARVASWCRSR
jgi:hypothetical protein